MNKYLSIVLLATLTSLDLYSQSQPIVPRLVVNIMIDQFSNEELEQFVSLYGQNGLKKILGNGTVYEQSKYSFESKDLASSIASVVTGTVPYYNGVTSSVYLNRSTLRPQECTFDTKYFISPSVLTSSTIGDELKLATNGAALIYSVAIDKDAAVLSGGHSADGAFWVDDKTSKWTTSSYYSVATQKWIKAYQASLNGSLIDKNSNVKELALRCVDAHAMGKDAISDLLCVTLSAEANAKNPNLYIAKEDAYRSIDQSLASLVSGIENRVGKDKVVFFITSSGYIETPTKEYFKYRIPTGVFNLSRATNLLNIYLNAIYGSGRFIDASHKNEIFLNKKLLEQKHIIYSDILKHAREFLIQLSGIKEVYTADLLLFNSYNQPIVRNGFNPEISGDIILKIAPGWKIIHEDTKEEYTPANSYIPFPIIIYGVGVKSKRVSTAVSISKIAPTIAKTIRIRAPNACTDTPLPEL